MPLNKNQTRRIQLLLKMLRQSRYPNSASFLDEMRRLDVAGVYELSAKTFSRDIAVLRDEFGAPVKYDASRKGFYLTNYEALQMILGACGEVKVFAPECLRQKLRRIALWMRENLE